MQEIATVFSGTILKSLYSTSNEYKCKGNIAIADIDKESKTIF